MSLQSFIHLPSPTQIIVILFAIIYISIFNSIFSPAKGIKNTNTYIIMNYEYEKYYCLYMNYI